MHRKCLISMCAYEIQVKPTFVATVAEDENLFYFFAVEYRIHPF